MPVYVRNHNRDSAFRAVCAQTIEAGQLVGLNGSGQLVLADADAATPIEAVGFALERAVAGETIGVAQIGRLENPAWSFTPGARLFTSGTAGGFTATAPATAGNIVQPVARALTATKVAVNVQLALAKVQASGSTTVAFL